MSGVGDLHADFAALAKIGRDPEGGWSRPAYGPADRAANDWFIARARSAGLTAGYDGFGNAIARVDGPGPAIVLGSHLDTVIGGGAFDGALGVVAALHAVRSIAAAGGCGRALEIIAFRDEEGRFGPFTGSTALTRGLTADEIGKRRAADGLPLAEALAGAGFGAALHGVPARDLSGIACYLELHIEQGPVLENAGLPIGVVTAIAGQERPAIGFTGRPDHAGTTPMTGRQDAFAAAASFAVRFREMILAEESDSLRGTIGIVKVAPNQGNVVPGDVRLGLEIRDISGEAVDRMARATEALARAAAEEAGCELRLRTVHAEPPVPMDPRLIGILTGAAENAGIGHMLLASGANHDAGVMARHVPAGMLFVPSRGGRSHCPEEHTDPEPIEAAATVLEAAIRMISEALDDTA